MLYNKYKKWYDLIIERANTRDAKSMEVYEKHHILPKSLGGNDKKENIVILTPKEHYICHLLLVKFTCGKSRRSMAWALHRMRYSRCLENFSSRKYDVARKLFVDNISGKNHPANYIHGWTYDHRARIKNSYTDSLKKLRSDQFKSNWRNLSSEQKNAKIDHLKNISKMGALAAKKALSGKKRPKCSQPGKNNPMAILVEIKCPDGNVVEIECLKSFCQKYELSYASMLQVSCGKNKQHRGYTILKKRRIGDANSNYN